MAKERRVRLAPRPAPEATGSDVTAVPARAAGPRRARHDTRSSEHVAALYARVPTEIKRRLDIASAMTGRNLSDVVAALIDAHVDPADPAKQAALERLLRQR